MIVRRDKLLTVLTMVLLLCGCPNRQTNSRVVYVAATAPAVTPSSAKPAGELVIEESAPPEPQEPPPEVTPQESTTQKAPARPRRRVVPTETPAEAQPTPPEVTEQPAIPAPALEPRESPEHQTELRLTVQQSQQSVQARITALESTQMANLDRKTLDGARMFLAQSRRAMETGDLQRAFNLARKASLLVDALEQKP